MKFRFLVIIGALALGVAACANGTVPPLAAAPPVSVLPTTTTFPDYSGMSIPPVKGTPTTVPVRVTGGNATINGKVSIEGATTGGINVHIDRFVGDASGGADTASASDGSFTFNGLLGGRYRIRAYRAPDATLTTPIVIFLNAGQTQSENMSLARFNNSAPTFASNINPSPPQLGDVANVVLQVTVQGVDNNGTAKSIGQSGLAITLVSAGGRTITSANPVLTDNAGKAVWTIRCDSTDLQALTAMMPDGTSANVNVAGCTAPPPTTTLPDPTVAAGH